MSTKQAGRGVLVSVMAQRLTDNDAHNIWAKEALAKLAIFAEFLQSVRGGVEIDVEY